MGTALAFAMQLLGSLPALLDAGKQVKDLIDHGNDKLKSFADEKRNPTDYEWEELNDRIEAKREELHS